MGRSPISLFVSLNRLAVVLVAAAGILLAQEPPTLPDGASLNPDVLSSGALMWLLGPSGAANPNPPMAAVSFGSNVDAADPAEDLAAGQSETSLAVSGQLVLAAWNDATGFIVTPSTLPKASLTGVGFSADAGASFTDLQGLPNDNARQRWFGDPAVKAIDGNHFIISSLYLPIGSCLLSGIRQYAVAVSVATIDDSGAVTFTRPIIAATGGSPCPPPPRDLAMLDKPWMSYDPNSHTLVLSYTRFFLFRPFFSGNGQIEIVRATVPDDPASLSSADFSGPIVVQPEEANVVNQGSYVVAAPGGDAYIAWERNVVSNRSNGDPYVYIRAALVPAGAFAPSVGGPVNPRVVTLDQVNSNGIGGVKSLDTVPIPGYSRGTGNDFPRIAFRPPQGDDDAGQVIVVWNDASLHPLGDIWLRALPATLDVTGNINKVNDDDSFALHFLPAVTVRDDGSIATSWYDRRLHGADSTLTDYFSEIRPDADTDTGDFAVTTGPTNWLAVGSLITPNFGDYTDNFSVGTTTFYNWSDGRIGVPQPFVDNSDNAGSANGMPTAQLRTGKMVQTRSDRASEGGAAD